MRPHKLRFSGIGSYPGDVEINFDDLNPMGLYLIVGPTGAGKTTILDAMTFALYGKVAQDRENAIACAHAHSKPPVIEFEFSQGGRRFLVHREPALLGKVASPAKQWIREYDSTGKEVDVDTQTRQVNDKCRSIIGLSAEEFMQVILLPQGKFQEFLLAKGSDKQKVLQTIFGTTTYRRIVDSLMASAKSLGDEVRTDVANLDNRWAVIDSAVETLAEIKECADLPDPRENLDSSISFITALSERLDMAAKEAQKVHAQTKSDQTQAKKEADRYDKGVQLGELRKEHAAQSRLVVAARTKLADHERAEPVVRAIEARAEAAEAVERLTVEVDRERTRLSKESKRFKIPTHLTRTLTDAIPSATPTTLSAELTKLYGKLEAASSTFEKIGELKIQLTRTTADRTKAEKSLRDAEKRFLAAKARTEKLSKEVTAVRKKSKGLAAAEKALNHLLALREKADVEGATAELERVNRALKAAQKKSDAAERAVRVAQDQRTKELAGALAAELSDGEACPVCGSTDHPKKARVAAKAKRSLEDLERDRKLSQNELTNAERDLEEAQRALEGAKKHHAQLPSPAQQTKIERTYEELQEAAESEDELAEELEDSKLELDDLKDSRAETHKEIVRLATVEKNVDTNLRSAEKEVSGFGSAAVVDGALDVCEVLEDILEEMEKQVRLLGKSEGQLKQAQTEFERQLKQSGYQTEKKAESSLLDDDVIEELEEAITEHDEREKTISRLEAAIGDAPLPKTRPDTETVEAKLLEAEEQANLTSQIAGAVRSARSSIESARRDIVRIGPKIEEKRRRADNALAVATVFDKGAGGVDGQLSLEVWVQRTLFEEVCLVANEQLRSLSSNRYSLTLEQGEGGVSRRRGSGLDIYVLDTHTGKTRPVGTMSGGEQFVASLSLALALAEVVQRHAGGIELPCLYIDEGFGGLDLESLDRAIEVLGKIQAAGRTIGIITHVETMQQQLPIGIRVNKSDRGSTLEVIGA